MPCQTITYPRSRENPSKMHSSARSAQPALFVFVLLAVFCFSTSAAGLAPLSLSSTSLAFGNVPVGAKSTRAVTLTNSGNLREVITRATVEASGFSISGLGLPFILAAHYSIAFDVTFAPTASGSVTGMIVIGCGTHGSLEISLSGTGVGEQPTLSLSATSLAFGSQSVGATSTAQTATLKNTGTASLSITNIALTGANPSDFAQSNNCGSSVAAGASCAISVTFTPAASGSFAAAVTVTDNASGSPQSVTLSGTGASTSSPAVSFSSTSVSFGNEPIDIASSSQTITVNNTGGATLTISSIALSGSDPADFTENNTCGSSLPAGGSCTVVTSFTPSASGSLTASLSITDNASGSPQTVALSGTGTHDVILSWSPSSTSGAVGYNVYRGTASGGESATPLNSTPIAGTTYDDESVQAGQTYYYTIATVSSSGTQSADSSEVSASVP